MSIRWQVLLLPFFNWRIIALHAMLVYAVQQRESAKSLHTSPPS